MESVVVSLSVCNAILTIALCAMASCIIPLWNRVGLLESKLKEVEKLRSDVEKIDEVVDNMLSMSGIGEKK